MADFSDFASAPGTDYVVPTWPGQAPVGKKWIEVTQRRDVGLGSVGREPIFAWEAKGVHLRPRLGMTRLRGDAYRIGIAAIRRGT
jgi:hypothetical protein